MPEEASKVSHVFLWVWMATALMAQPPESRPANDRPRLAFKQEGRDLVVAMTVEVPDSPHALWTHAELVTLSDPHLEGPRHPPKLGWVELHYQIIQCRDDPILMQSRHKKVEVTWRIGNHEKADVNYRVIEQFTPSAAELKALAPKLREIAEETEKRKRGPLAVP
jgi:hypothetical protein